MKRRTLLTLPAGLVAASALPTGALATGGLTALAGPAAAETSALSWPRGQVLPSYPQPERLDFANVSELSGDDRALLTSLQGVVNRKQPRIYLHLSGESDAPLWLKGFGLPTTTYTDPWKILAKYRREIAGAIVYDPAVPDTINVATTLAGLENAVIANADQVKAHGLKIVKDLRGKFADDRLAIYRWQLENLYPRCTHRMLTGIPPTMRVSVPDVVWKEIAREPNRVTDSSNRKIYDLDLSSALGKEAVYVRFSDAFTDAGHGPSVKQVTILANDVKTGEFFADTPEEVPYLFDAGNSSIGGDANRFADGGNYFIYRFQPPAGTTKLVIQVDMWNQFLVNITDTAPTRTDVFPYFRDYIVGSKAMVFWLPPSGAFGDLMTEIFETVAPTTPYLGWFSNDVAGEWSGVGLASKAGLEVLAADFYQNGTVFSGARAPINPKPPVRRTPKLENKVYVTFTFGEGDNIQYDQHRMRDTWDDPNRGKAPMNWTINPLLKDIGPSILSYYQKTATENDLLVAGPSGAGYTYPGLWPDADIDKFTAMTGQYMRATGMNVIHCFNNDGKTWIEFTERLGTSYSQNTPALGIFQAWERGNHIDVIDGMPIVGDYSPGGTVPEFKQRLEAHVAGRDPNKPLFVACGIGAWGWSPTQVSQLAASLTAPIEVVRGDVFFDLMRSG